MLEAIADGQAAHPAHAGHRHGQDLHRLSDRLEAVSQPLEPEPASRSRRPRILFLADRNILADQAYNAFSAFPEDALVRIEPDDIRKKGRVPKNGSLFFTIFQTFMSGPPKDGKPSPYFGEYPPDFFDFIVIDECHRGGANDESNWRDILDYFAPAVQLGLTATPKRKDNVDTYAYFGEPVYIYSLKEGINDGFLTPFKVKQISTTLDEYVYTPDDTADRGRDRDRQALRRKATSTRSSRSRSARRTASKLFMEQIDQREKTLVFCATQDHALAVRDLINQMKTSTDPNYCQRVTANDGALGEQHLRDFQDNEKTIPTILTTSQKLSTGVDARNIRNIVLMRPINSMIEFKQIIGRGTRLYDGKDYFTIYDFVKAHHHFNDPEWDGEPVEPEPTRSQASTTAPTDRTPPARRRCRDAATTRPAKIKVKLADGKERTIQHMMVTTFWHPDGTPMSAQQFMEMLFGKLPEFFKDEAELRALWSAPDTRKKLLAGAGREGLRQRPAGRDAEDHRRREERPLRRAGLRRLSPCRRSAARSGRPAPSRDNRTHFNSQAAGLPRLRAVAVREGGCGELDQEKLSPLLRLKYRTPSPTPSPTSAGRRRFGRVFAGFQKYLYEAPDQEPPPTAPPTRPRFAAETWEEIAQCTRAFRKASRHAQIAAFRREPAARFRAREKGTKTKAHTRLEAAAVDAQLASWQRYIERCRVSGTTPFVPADIRRKLNLDE